MLLMELYSEMLLLREEMKGSLPLGRTFAPFRKVVVTDDLVLRPTRVQSHVVGNIGIDSRNAYGLVQRKEDCCFSSLGKTAGESGPLFYTLSDLPCV